MHKANKLKYFQQAEEEQLNLQNGDLELIKQRAKPDSLGESNKEALESEIILLEKIKALQKENQNLSDESRKLSAEIQHTKFNSKLKSYLIYFIFFVIIAISLLQHKMYDILHTQIKIPNPDINIHNYHVLRNHFKSNFNFEKIYELNATDISASNLIEFKEKIVNLENLIYIFRYKGPGFPRKMGFFRSKRIDSFALKHEVYFKDDKSFLVDFHNKKVFAADENSDFHYNSHPDYYLSVGGDSKTNKGFSLDQNGTLIFSKSSAFKMSAESDLFVNDTVMMSEIIKSIVIYQISFK